MPAPCMYTLCSRSVLNSGCTFALDVGAANVGFPILALWCMILIRVQSRSLDWGSHYASPQPAEDGDAGFDDCHDTQPG